MESISSHEDKHSSFCHFTCFLSSSPVRRIFWMKAKCSELFTLFNSFTASNFKQIFLRDLCQTHDRNAESKEVTKACPVAKSVCVENTKKVKEVQSKINSSLF